MFINNVALVEISGSFKNLMPVFIWYGQRVSVLLTKYKAYNLKMKRMYYDF